MVLLSYLLPALVALAAGNWNPVPPSSPWHTVFPAALAALITAVSLRVHPNGLNGPAVAKSQPESKGHANVPLLIVFVLTAIGFLGLAGCATARGGVAVCIGGCVTAGPVKISATTECGSICNAAGCEELYCQPIGQPEKRVLMAR